MTAMNTNSQDALPEDLTRKLEEIAFKRGLSPVEVVRRHFQTSDVVAPGETQSWRAPQSLDELKPREPAPEGTTAVQFIRGHWPGEETDTDEEILASLKQMDFAPKPSHEELTAELRAWRTPQSLDELKPRALPPPGMTAMEYIRGKWPGDETEEELLATLKEMG